MSKTVLMFNLGLACGHFKTVKRAVEENAPPVGSIVNCLGCTRVEGGSQLVVTRVADIELVAAGLE